MPYNNHKYYPNTAGDYKAEDVLIYPQAEPVKQPYFCPVCYGKGFVDLGFYNHGLSTSTNPETCRTCIGKGIIWGVI